MEELPKLEIEGLGWDTTEGLSDFEQAKRFPFHSRDLTIVAEGKAIRSYQELVEIGRKAAGEGKVSIKVIFIPMVVGG